MIFVFFIIMAALTIGLATMADKIKANFKFELLPKEILHTSKHNVNYHREGKIIGNTGLLYLTDKRLLFFSYKFNFLGLIPFVGDEIQGIFIEPRAMVEIHIKNITSCTTAKTIYKGSRSRITKYANCDITILTRLKETFLFRVPLTIAEYDLEKPEILSYLELMIMESK